MLMLSIYDEQPLECVGKARYDRLIILVIERFPKRQMLFNVAFRHLSPIYEKLRKCCTATGGFSFYDTL